MKVNIDLVPDVSHFNSLVCCILKNAGLDLNEFDSDDDGVQFSLANADDAVIVNSPICQFVIIMHDFIPEHHARFLLSL